MLVMHVITHLGAGGAEASLFQLVKNNQCDRQVVVSLRGLGVYGDQLRAHGVAVYTLDMGRGRISISGFKSLFGLIRKVRPDVIQTWMYHSDLFAGVVARLAFNNSVCWGIHHSNLDRDANSVSLLWIVRACAALSWIVPKYIISCSVRSKEIHKKWFYRKSIFSVVPNGYDIEQFNANDDKRAEFRQSIGVEEEVLLGMVGRWHPQKDHANLIKAMVLVNDKSPNLVRCVLVGNDMDSKNKSLTALIAKENAANYFILLGTSDDVPAVMNGIDIHVLSSCGEAFPNVVAEAMACQTPCIVTNVGDAALIVNDKGWVVPPSSSKDLASAVLKAIDLAKDEKSWNQRCISCRDRIVDKYEIGRVVEQYREVWKKALSGS